MTTYTFYYRDGSTRVLRLSYPLTQVEHKGKIIDVLQQLNEYWGTSLTPPAKVDLPIVPPAEKLKQAQTLKTAIHGHKSLKRNPVLHKQFRDELISELVGFRGLPNWGSIRFNHKRPI